MNHTNTHTHTNTAAFQPKVLLNENIGYRSYTANGLTSFCATIAEVKTVLLSR